MRGHKNLLAVLGTVFILVLAGAMIATGATAQDDGTGAGTGQATATATVEPTATVGGGDEGGVPEGGVDSGFGPTSSDAPGPSPVARGAALLALLGVLATGFLMMRRRAGS